MKCPYCIKVCSKCNRILVANEMNFRKAKNYKYGLYADCKVCRNEYHKEYKKINKKLKSEENPFDNIDINKTWNNCPFCIKVCTKCGKILVANEMNFNKHKNGKYGLQAECKVCRNEEDKKYREVNKEEIKEYGKQWREEHKEEIKEYNKQYAKQYYEDNKEELKEKSKQYKEEHKEEMKQWREEHKEELKEYGKQYRENNPNKVFNNSNKRRKREENQGNGVTKEQWFEMFEFFNWECAYSGVQLDKDNRSVDHIIPLAEGGLNEIWNCVPMLRNYNTSKHANDMLEWYIKQEFYSEERLQKIYEWVEYAYNKWANK